MAYFHQGVQDLLTEALSHKQNIYNKRRKEIEANCMDILEAWKEKNNQPNKQK